MLYAQLNCRDGALTFARAGHPLPLHVPANGNLEYWSATGTFLGQSADATSLLVQRTE